MAEPLVLLPGMMCDARLFGPQIAELSAEFSIMVSPVSTFRTRSRFGGSRIASSVSEI